MSSRRYFDRADPRNPIWCSDALISDLKSQDNFVPSGTNFVLLGTNLSWSSGRSRFCDVLTTVSWLQIHSEVIKEQFRSLIWLRGNSRDKILPSGTKLSYLGQILSSWDKFVLAPGQIKILSLDKKLSKKMFRQKVILHRLGGGKKFAFFSVFVIRRPQSFNDCISRNSHSLKRKLQYSLKPKFSRKTGIC